MSLSDFEVPARIMKIPYNHNQLDIAQNSLENNALDDAHVNVASHPPTGSNKLNMYIKRHLHDILLIMQYFPVLKLSKFEN